MKFSIPLLLSYRNRKQKTQTLTKTLENNKAKGLTSANQGVQIHNIWHSSVPILPALEISEKTWGAHSKTW
jgi:hypothetical protein